VSKKKCIFLTESEDRLVRVYVCTNQSKSIYNEILINETRERKFRRIIESIFRGHPTKDTYEAYTSYPGTAAVKLSKGSTNIRIYCKLLKIEEDQNTITTIILSKAHHKKNQKLEKKEITILNAIQKTQYELKRF